MEFIVFNIYGLSAAMSVVGLIFLASIALYGLGDKLTSVMLRVTSIVLMVFGFMNGVFQTADITDDREEKISQEIKAVYGIELSNKEMSDLLYPEYKPHHGTTETFGTTIRENNGSNDEMATDAITLVWQSNEFKLFQVNTEGLTEELTRVK